jgi:hypothetical protein
MKADELASSGSRDQEPEAPPPEERFHGPTPESSGTEAGAPKEPLPEHGERAVEPEEFFEDAESTEPDAGAAPEMPRSPARDGSDDRAADDRFRLLGLAALAVLLLLVLAGGFGYWKTRTELAAVRAEIAAEIAAVKDGARRAELFQARAAVARARSELGPLREVLSPELAAEVERADGILRSVAGRLGESR